MLGRLLAEDPWSALSWKSENTLGDDVLLNLGGSSTQGNGESMQLAVHEFACR
jgi:hypothetical protein